MAIFCTRRGQAPKLVNYIEYIESTGTQYIDTGFIPNQDTRVDIIAAPMSIADAGTGTGFIPYGAGEGYNSKAFECYTVGGQLEFNYAGQYDFLGEPAVQMMHTISHNKNKVTVTANAKQYTKDFTYGTFTAPYTITLFAIHRASMLCGLARIYSCQIYDNGTLIRNYYPCLDPDGVACLYDKVNKEYVYNSGTGSFSYSGSSGSNDDNESSVEVGTIWTYITNGTFTVPADGDYKIEMHGGGGGGGQGLYIMTDDGEPTGVSGSGGGGSGEIYTVTLAKSDVKSITIGVGGNRGSDTTNAGTGGTTTFGSLSVAGGSGALLGSLYSDGWGRAGDPGTKSGSIATDGQTGFCTTYGPYLSSSYEWTGSLGGYGNSSNGSQSYGNGGRGASVYWNKNTSTLSINKAATAGSAGAVIITYLG
jgi:hypothetical protein